MKNLFAVLLVAVVVVVLVGCGSGLPGAAGEVVKVIRIPNNLNFTVATGIKLTCESANLDGRKIILKGVKQFGTDSYNGWVCGAAEGSNLVLEIPPDAEYQIYFGEQENILPKVK